MEEIKNKKIVTAINAVMNEVGSLETDARNKHDKYDYISADKILERVGASMAENNLVVVPGVTEQEVTTFPRQGKGPIFFANLKMHMRIAVDDAEFVAPWTGAGADYRVPDKAVYKAITSGQKYFLMKLFCIGVGNEDGEHEPASEKAYVPTSKTSPQDTDYGSVATAEGIFLKDMEVAELAEYANRLTDYLKGDLDDKKRVIAENKQAAVKYYIDQKKKGL